MQRRRGTIVGTAVAIVLVASACGSDREADTTTPAAPAETSPGAAPGADEAADPDELFPDVIAASAERSGDTWTFSATLSSPYDTPERYADAWRVVGPDGTVYGVRELAHDHQNEQPFTRSLTGVEIPTAVAVVVVEGRDQVSGWGGATVEVLLDPG